MRNVSKRLVSLLLSFAMVLSVNGPAFTAIAVELDGDVVAECDSDANAVDDVFSYDDSNGDIDCGRSDADSESDGDMVGLGEGDESSSSQDDSGTPLTASEESLDGNQVWIQAEEAVNERIEEIENSDLPESLKETAISEETLKLPYHVIETAERDDPLAFPEGVSEPDEPGEAVVDEASGVEDVQQVSDEADGLMDGVSSDGSTSVSDTSSSADSVVEDSGTDGVIENGSDTSSEDVTDATADGARSAGGDSSAVQDEAKDGGVVEFLSDCLSMVLKSSVVHVSADGGNEVPSYSTEQDKNHNGNIPNAEKVPTVGYSYTYMPSKCGLGVQFRTTSWDDVKRIGSGLQQHNITSGEFAGWKIQKIKNSLRTEVDSETKARSNKCFIDMKDAGFHYKEVDRTGPNGTYRQYEKENLWVRCYIWNKWLEPGSKGTTACFRENRDNRVWIGNLDQLTKDDRRDRNGLHIGVAYEFWTGDPQNGGELVTNEYGFTVLQDLDRQSFKRKKTGQWVRFEPEGWFIPNSSLVSTHDGYACYGQAPRGEDSQTSPAQEYKYAIRYYPNGYKIHDNTKSSSHDNVFNYTGGRIYGAADTGYSDPDKIGAEEISRRSRNQINLALGFKIGSDGTLSLIHNAGTLYAFNANFVNTAILYKMYDNTQGAYHTAPAGSNKAGQKVKNYTIKVNGKKEKHSFKTLKFSQIKSISNLNPKYIVPYSEDGKKESSGWWNGKRSVAYYTDLTDNTAKNLLWNSDTGGAVQPVSLVGQTVTIGGQQVPIVAQQSWAYNAKDPGAACNGRSANSTWLNGPVYEGTGDNYARYGGDATNNNRYVKSSIYGHYLAQYVESIGNVDAKYKSPFIYRCGTLKSDTAGAGDEQPTISVSVTYVGDFKSTPTTTNGEPACGVEYDPENAATPAAAIGTHYHTVTDYSDPHYDSEGHFTGYGTKTEPVNEYGTAIAAVHLVDNSPYMTQLSGFQFRLTGNASSGATVDRTGSTDSSGNATFYNVPRGSYVFTLIGTPDSPGKLPDWWNAYYNGYTFSNQFTLRGEAASDCNGGAHEATHTVNFWLQYERADVVVDNVMIDAASPEYPGNADGIKVRLHGTSSSGVDIDMTGTVSGGTVTFANVPVNDLEDSEPYTLELVSTTQQPSFRYTSETWNLEREVVVEFDRGRCSSAPVNVSIVLQPIEAEFQVWLKDKQGNRKRTISNAIFKFRDSVSATNWMGVDWTFTSKGDLPNYAPGPAIGKGQATITYLPNDYMVFPLNPTPINIADKAGIQHFDIEVDTTSIEITAIDTATQRYLEPRYPGYDEYGDPIGSPDDGVMIDIYNSFGTRVYSGQWCPYSVEDVSPGTYTIVVTHVPDRYDIPASNSGFLTFVVERIAETQSYDIYIDHLGSITIEKYDEWDRKLPDVTFKLTGRDRDGVVSETRLTNSQGKAVFITQNSDSSGNLVSNKLKTGTPLSEARYQIPGGVDHITYTLVETKTAPGSNLTLLPEQIDCTLPMVYTDAEVAATQGTENPIDTSNGWHNDTTGQWYFFDVTYKIHNDTVFAPPATGGEGNKALGVAGVVGVLGVSAGAWLLLSKRKEHAE